MKLATFLPEMNNELSDTELILEDHLFIQDDLLVTDI